MNAVSCFFKKRKLKSLYAKWILLFTTIIVLSHTFTFFLTFRYIVVQTTNSLSEKLYLKAEYLKRLGQQGVSLTEDILINTGDTDINFRILNNYELPDDMRFYEHIISYDMLRRAIDGEIVSSYSQEFMYSLPFCLVEVNGQIALLTPYLNGNIVTSVVLGLKNTIFTSAIIASVCIVFALIIIIRPIKKVTAAAREVAGGNFNVKLKSKSVDEVGQLIESFNLMTAELQKNDYLKKDFISSVSHEFKTPITSIEGFARLLKSNGLTAEQTNDYSDVIIRETTRLSNLSSNLLKLSILDSSGFEPTKKSFYLDEQIRGVILLLENQWTEKNIQLDIDMDEIMFCGNEELLSQVWINLIQNAVKFSPFGKTVGITLRENSNSVCFVITDEGPGISQEHGDKIFDRFYKADKSRSRDGNGLGLSIAKRIVDLSKGSIFYESNNGKGTVFTVELPNLPNKK